MHFSMDYSPLLTRLRKGNKILSCLVNEVFLIKNLAITATQPANVIFRDDPRNSHPANL